MNPSIDPEFAYAEFRNYENLTSFFGHTDHPDGNWYDELFNDNYTLWLSIYGDIKNEM